MKIQLTFNRQIHQQQSQLQFKLAWEKGLRGNLWRILGIVLGMALGGLMLYREYALGFLFIGWGLHGLLSIWTDWKTYLTSKKSFFDKVEKVADFYEEYEKEPIWEFTDESLKIIKSPQNHVELPWKLFDYYQIIEDNLFFTLTTSTEPSLTVGKEEVTEEEWKQLIEIVDSVVTHKPYDQGKS
ncbi:MAG: hypothetical protein SchgKO_10810 [Schleiferiaceae bacterium]